MVDEVRRRVQQDIPGHRGPKGDPLYRIRRTLQLGPNTPPTSSPGSAIKSSATSTTPPPAWSREPVTEVGLLIPDLCPIPEVRRLCRTLKQ